MMLSIGPYAVDNGLFLAPMAGVTDLPFRTICRELGAGMVTGEMVTSDLSLRHSRKSSLRRVHRDEPLPRSIQIVGWDPGMMADAARYNVAQGASVIDINMGCPARKVCKKAAGSALLADKVLVAQILQAVVGAVDVPVTLKIRTGIARSCRNGVEISRIAEDCGIALLAIHGRTREDRYLGDAEYETIRQIKREVDIPVIANGDIGSEQKARQVLDYTGADGVMIGRAAHGNPWIFKQLAHYLETGKVLPKPGLSQIEALVIRHLQMIHLFYGRDQGVRVARKHIKWYSGNLPRGREFFASVSAVTDPGEQVERVHDYFKSLVTLNKAA